MVVTFQQTLSQGQIGESLIACYLRSKGWMILPVYEKEIDNKVGPRLFLPYGYSDKELVAPDILAMKAQQVRWFEVKNKSTGTYSRKMQCWQTGIDTRLWKQYKRVQTVTQWPVWVLFLQRGEPPCPTGLYGCPITQSLDAIWLDKMVYWTISKLKMLATLADVLGGEYERD